MSDVFISYSSEDRERVRPLAQALEARGLSVWWDRALAAGDDYSAVIQKALDEAKAVIVVWSRNSVDSPWVRDEAGRARDTKRLTPILLDRVTIPMGFGAINAEDFTNWNGSPSAAQVELLYAALAARVEGKAPSGIDALRRKSLKARIRLVTVLTVAALVVAIAAGGLYIADRDKRNTAAASAGQQTPSSQSDLNRLLELVASGQLTGDQAVELAKLLQNQAFVDVKPQATQAALASATPEAQTASISAQELDSNAKATFQDAAAQLLKDPDPQVRAAAIEAAAPESRAAGMEKLWTIAKTNGPSSAAIYRYCGAIGSLTDDSRTRVALERARDANPNDMRLWRLLSADYAKGNDIRSARGAKLVGEGLTAAANGQGDAASANLEQALPLLEQSGAKAFVLGQLGDAAAKRDDWAAAEKRYSAAVELQPNNAGGAAIDTAKLARAQAQQGDRRRACQTLQRAKRLGVNSAPAQIEQMCQTAPSAAPSAAPQP
jgi:TIR domain